MTYTIVFRQTAKKVIERLPSTYRKGVKKALFALRENPMPLGCKRLHTDEGRYFRIRVGPYRIVYVVADGIRIVTIIRIGHRKDVYRKL